MSTRNDRFNASMRSLDELTASFEDPTKANVFSDKGKGVERKLDEIDKTEGMGVITGRTGILLARSPMNPPLPRTQTDYASTRPPAHTGNQSDRT